MIIKAIKSGWRDFTHIKYLKEMIGAAGAAIIIIALSYVGYTWNVQSREATAQKLFAECHSLYEQALSNELSKEKTKQNNLWLEVENMCEQAYKRASSSYIAPFFLAYQAEALLHQQKQKEAIDVMNQMLNKLSAGSPFYGLYDTKRALMKLDMDDKSLQDQGLQELQKLAADPYNPVQDQALYYLGQYYWSTNEIAKAQDAWKKLKEIGSKANNNFPSPWLEALQEKIDIA